MNKKYSMIVQNIKNLADGKTEIPVVAEGGKDERLILTMLEKLRRGAEEAKLREIKLREHYRVTAASVAHDLKTPLAIISGYAESLADGMDDKDYLSLIMSKIDDMNGLVLSLAESAEEEAKAISGLREAVSAREFFNRILPRYAHLAQTKKIKFKIGRIPNVNLYLDKNEIARAIQNLITNAVKYSGEKGKIKIKFGIRNNYLQVSVCDKGIGIAYENLVYVFDKFYKESSGDKSSSGLGLYIVKEIAESHGGTVGVKSKRGKGSKFSIKLPLLDASAENPRFQQKFERLPYSMKMFLLCVFPFFFSSVYRILRFVETRHTATLTAGILALPFFILAWPMDLISVIFSGKVTVFSE